jgi:hydrophobe/amphiphile efflux-1 (HAE1) family protein
MFSRFFIERPIFASVLSLLIVLAGLAALRVLPVARYPEIAPPVVSVTAIYPGASAEVVERTVAAPIEEQINGVERMLYMNSVSSGDGRVSINVTFEVGTNLDIAAVNVNNRVRQADAKLPQEVRRQGVTVAKSSASFLVVAAFFSPDDRYDTLFLSNFVSQNILDEIKRVPGTTNVQIFGARDYAMRIWMQPDRMAQLGITVGDIANAVSEQNTQYAAGKIGATPGNTEELTLTVTAKGRLLEVADFANILLKTSKGGASVRLSDVARVELGSRDYNLRGRINGHHSSNLGIFLQTGANALDTRKAVEAKLQQLQAKFPPGLTYATPYDTTPFVKESIIGVLKTLAEAMVLVFIVVFVFLQSWRATIIPTLAVPVSLIGTLAGLHLLGYSINTLTLFGMVLAIGIVVDDAIVVLENVERLMREEGMSPKAAAIEAMHEVTGPVIAIVLVLVAAFGPIAFLGGLAGELYRQFAVTMSIAVVLSGFVALTLTPALCAVLLKPGGHRPSRVFGGFFAVFNRGFLALTRGYTHGVGFLMRRALLGIFLFAAMVAVTGVLWKTVPNGLVPDEDQGYFLGVIVLPQGAALQRTDAVTSQVEANMQGNKNIAHISALVGLDILGGGGLKSSTATMFFPLRPWAERDQTAKQLVGQAYAKNSAVKQGLPLFFSPPAIQGLGQVGGFEFYLRNKGEGGVRRLGQVLPEFLAEANKQPELAGVKSFFQANSPQLFVDVDNDKARAMGVVLSDVYNTLAATLGSYYVNDFNKSGRIYTVQLQADAPYRAKPEHIGNVFVRSTSGQMIPLRAFTKVSFVAGPDSVERFNALPAIKVLGEAKPGYSSGQAIAAMERVAAQVLPGEVIYEWGGASFQEKRSSDVGNMALVAGVVMIFLILAAQYEKWSLPFSVLLAMPFGIFGALLAVYLRHFTNDVYFQIGLVTLLGLSAKNAILIVEFAVMKVHQGYAPVAAALEAARLRFRPILMTSLAFILGVAPLAFSSGAGAGARQSLGTGVLGGMLGATFLAIFFVPLFFKLIHDRRLKTTPQDFEHPEPGHPGLAHSAVKE